MAWLSGYTTRKKLTTDTTKVDADLTNFPVLVKLTSTNFDFAKANADGFDIRFTSSDGETLLKYERERHDSANSLAEYWVKVPAVSGTVDTDFYIYYRTTDTADGADPTAVWDANYVMIHHLIGAAYTNLDDSTVNDNDVTAENGTPSYNIDAKIGKGVELPGGETGYLTTTNNASLQLSTAVTVEVFSLWDSVSKDQPLVVKFYGGDSNRGYYLSSPWSGDRDELMLLLGDANANYVFCLSNDFNLETATWYHLAGTWSTGDNTIRVYKDGVASGVTVSKSSNIGNPPRAVDIGYAYGAMGESFDGIIDEVRISNIARSAAWIKASYNSGNDTLLTYGVEESQIYPISVTDSGTGTEILALLTKTLGTDSGGGTDVVQVLAKLTIDELGVGAEAGMIDRNFEAVSVYKFFEVLQADSAVATEALTILCKLAIQDTVQGQEAISILNKLLLQDAGTGTDLINIVSKILIQDSGLGAEILNILSKIAVNDLAYSQEAIDILSRIAIQDSGVSEDLVGILNKFLIQDSGIGIDEISIIFKHFIQDIAAGQDLLNILVKTAISDGGLGIEAISILTKLAVSDTGIAQDVIAILTKLTIQDIGIGTDITETLISVAIEDSGLTTDAVNVLRQIMVEDSGIVVEAIGILRKILIFDTGLGEDQAELLIKIAISDTSIGTDKIILAIIKQIADIGTGIDLVKIAKIVRLVRRIAVLLTKGQKSSILTKGIKSTIKTKGRKTSIKTKGQRLILKTKGKKTII